MGDDDSDWTGVYFEAPEDLVTDTTYALDLYSASNTDFLDSATANYDDDSFFYGEVDNTDDDPYVYIIRQTPRSE